MGQDKGNPVKLPAKHRQHLDGVARKEAGRGDPAVGSKIAQGIGMGDWIEFDADDLASLAVTTNDQRQGPSARAEHGHRLPRAHLGSDASALMGRTHGIIDLAEIKMELNAVFPVHCGQSLLTGNHRQRSGAMRTLMFARSLCRDPEVRTSCQDDGADLPLKGMQLRDKAQDRNIADPVKATGQPGGRNLGKSLL